jgi:dynein heavy chain
MGEGITKILEEIEREMRNTVKNCLRQALNSNKKENEKRVNWIMTTPSAQSILTADSIEWTRSTELALEADDPLEELESLSDSLIMDLKEVIEKVRTKLPNDRRRMINSLITQDVHYRDIVDNLRDFEVDSKDDFKWQQQLRFYQDSKLEVYCKQINTELAYANEYLGVPSKLAITPLTDRCWITITTALYLHMGCAPVGPAGTGKTESVKDLAKNLGTYLIICNCSEQTTVHLMNSQFMGVICTGAWLCLDEFNRIDIEVLSVIAQQVLQMKNALSNHDHKRDHSGEEKQSYFDGKPISMSKFKHLTVFTTMNPGYAGRTELPDNLKVLFRSVSMMVPDFALIAEVLLFSEGFFNAKDLAVKMTKLYKLASDQLSQQKHYDFGMRAVKSILSMAGMLKRANPTLDEDLLLIQAMRDTNLPKFLINDIKLFQAIVQDLFPGKQYEKKFDDLFITTLKMIIKRNNLQEGAKFVEKCCELDDIMKIRFGCMMVGDPMTGKSTVLQTLKDVYNHLAREQEFDEHPQYDPIDCVVLNPKSISKAELYGETNPITGDFKNGLASRVFAEFASREVRERKWIVFDGPVDSLWIENLNSVLDDSMTLCLSNGKRIKLRMDIRALFEVQDVNQASPATVSRMGMVYLDKDVIHPLHLLRTKLRTEFEECPLTPEQEDFFFTRMDNHFDKFMAYFRKSSREPVKTLNNNLITSLVRIIKSFFVNQEFKTRFVPEDEDLIGEQEKSQLGKIFMFAVAWSLMATVDENSSSKLDQFVANLFPPIDLPRGSLFDSFLDLRERDSEWKKWESLELQFEYQPSMRWTEILVPTVNTKRYSNLVRRSIETKYPIYLSGVTGTGKTVICQNILKEMSAEEQISPVYFTFSAKTSSVQVQAHISSKMNVLRRDRDTIRGSEKVYCLIPKNPKKTLTVYVDDINMPEVELYGAQPPIELLRQAVDQKGFYDRQILQWRELENTVIIATSSPPGNGRAHLSDRFMRHFHIVNIHSNSEEIMKNIFGTILKNFFQSFSFNPKIQTMDDNIVMGTLLLYREMLTRMLPTPKKSHYTFNLRDVSKVFQGIVAIRPEKFKSSEIVGKLWVHECSRVFSDRLVTDKDRDHFSAFIANLTQTYAGGAIPKDEISSGKIIFGDFMNPATRDFEYLDKMDNIIKQISIYMYDTPIHIELFVDCVKHLTRLNRILRQVRGNGLLIGIGGSGKKSLVTVASEMAGTLLRQIEPTNKYGMIQFRAEIFERMLYPAGVLGKETTFLFTDTNVIHEDFLEEVNNLINTGEIMLDKEQLEKLKKDIDSEMTKLKINEDPIDFFVRRVRDKLHIILAMSPIGDALRTRMRNFPSFVTSCTIDWLDTWPLDALTSVATKMLEESIAEENIEKDVGKALVEICVQTHAGAIAAAENFLVYLKRTVFFTPKTYIDLITTFKLVLKEMKGGMEANIEKLTNGLAKLIESGEKVEFYKEQLKEMQPKLEEKTVKVQELIKILTIDKEEANKQVSIVEEEKSKVQVKAEQIEEIKLQADEEVAKAKPVLMEAMAALDVLKRGDISELKGSKLEGYVGEILGCVQMLFDRDIDEKSIRSSLTAVNYIEQLKSRKPEQISRQTVINVRQKIKNKEITEAKLKTSNLALVSIFKWINGMCKAQESAEIVSKMQAKAQDITIVYNKQMEELRVKETELNLVLDKVNRLEKQYSQVKEEKDQIDRQIEKTIVMLDNSGKLTQGLADEHIRWKETVKILEASRVFILGDAFIASAFISYLGPFTGSYRTNLLQTWRNSMEELRLKLSPKFSFEESIGDISTIRKWNMCGLPSNSISVCNGLLTTRSSSYPYLVDPQLQGNKWLKKLEEENNLKIVKANDYASLPIVVESCLQNNIPCMIEDCDEALPAYLDPLLLKQFIRKGQSLFVKLGDSPELQVENDFRIYFTTKVSNPNFLPEIFIRVSIINFTVTEDGLEEQLLANVIQEVMPEIEEKKVNLIVSIAEGKNELRRNEDMILRLLKESQGNILENTPLIENLEASKKKSDEVKIQLEENEYAQVQIETARNKYKPVAVRGSLLYFVICDLVDIDPMYQFSLSYITRLFVNTIRQCLKITDVEDKCALYVNKITENIYLNVCRGLFNEHKKVFAFLVATKIQKRSLKIKQIEFDCLLKGVPIGATYPNVKMPPILTLDKKNWERLLYVCSFSESVRDLLDLTVKDAGVLHQVFEVWAGSENPLVEALPKDAEGKISNFQKLLLIQCIKPNLILTSMITYVIQFLS